MFKPGLKLVLVLAVVAVAFSAFAPQADAFHFHRAWGYYGGWGYGYSACCTPTYTTCYTPCYTPCYRTCFAPRYTACCDPCATTYVRYRHCGFRRAYAWRGFGCCGVRCATDCCCTATETCCGSVNGGSDVPTTNQPTPAVAPSDPAPVDPAPAPAASDPGPAPVPPQDAEPAITPPSTTGTVTPGNSGLLTVWVPYDAKVSVNGMATNSTGSRRQYVSYGLKPGFSYTYEIKAEVVRDGADGKPTIVEDVRTITLTAGQKTSVAFGFNVTPGQDLAAGW